MRPEMARWHGPERDCRGCHHPRPPPAIWGHFPRQCITCHDLQRTFSSFFNLYQPFFIFINPQRPAARCQGRTKGPRAQATPDQRRQGTPTACTRFPPAHKEIERRPSFSDRCILFQAKSIFINPHQTFSYFFMLFQTARSNRQKQATGVEQSTTCCLYSLPQHEQRQRITPHRRQAGRRQRPQTDMIRPPPARSVTGGSDPSWQIS
jgi:hypothetical protein